MMNEMNALFETQISSVMSNMVRDNGFRLDSNAYSKEGTGSEEILNKSQLEMKVLTDFAQVLQLTVFGKRAMRSTPKNGIPLYSGSEMNKYNHETNFYISSQYKDSLPYGMIVKDGWVLITLSGTIGTIGMSSDGFLDTIVTDDVMRIIPKEQSDFGFLYTYLRSPLSQNLIKSLNYGSVVQHIKDFQIESLLIPNMSFRVRSQIYSLIQKVIQLRCDAKKLLKNAELSFKRINKLPKIRLKDANYLDPEKEIESSFVSSKAVIRNNHSGSEYRLDAHFYNPIARLAIDNIKKAKTEVKTIEDVTERVFLVPRFKRNYVDKKYGHPFLSGKNIIQTRPADLKYLSKSETKNLELYYLEKEWILITCSGTIGRTCFIWENYENYTATQHILRVVPDDTHIDPGYLYAFLSSQYGKLQVLRYSHGSVIDEITDKQIKKVLIPMPSENEQKQIGNLVRSAYEKRAEAIRLEDEAQEILMEALT